MSNLPFFPQALPPSSQAKVKSNDNPYDEKGPEEDDRQDVPNVLLESSDESIIVVDKPL